MSAEKYEPVIGGTFRVGGSAAVQEVRRTSDGARYVAKTLDTEWDTMPVLREINDPRQGLIPGHTRRFVEVDDWCFVPSGDTPEKEHLRLFMPWCQPLDEVVMRLASGAFFDRPPTSDEQRRQRLGWVADLAIGMALLHAAGTVHSDAHISNAFIGADGSARWGDLGAGDFYRSSSGPVGHPSSCAPSVWSAGQCLAVDDLYSLAHTAATILSGSRPHVALDAHELPPDVRQWPSTATVAGLPKRLDQVIARAAAWNREDRCSDALEFARELLDTAGYHDVRADELAAAEIGVEELKRLVDASIQLRAPAATAQPVHDESPTRNTVDTPMLSAVLAAQADLQRALAEREREIEQLQIKLRLVSAQLARRATRPIRSLFIRDEEPAPSPGALSREAPAAHPVRASGRREQPNPRPPAPTRSAPASARPVFVERLSTNGATSRSGKQSARKPLFGPSDEKTHKPASKKRPRGRGPLGAYLLRRYVLAQIDWCIELLGDLLDDTYRAWSVWELDRDNAKRCGRDELVGFLAYLDAWTARETRERTVRSRLPAWRRRRALITECSMTIPEDYDVDRACSHVHKMLQADDPALRTPGRLAPLILRDRLADQLDRMSDALALSADAHRQLPTLLRVQRVATIVMEAQALLRTARSALESNGAAPVSYGWEPDELEELSEIVFDRWTSRAVREVPDQKALERCEALVAELRIPPDRIAGIDSPSLWVASARHILHSSEREMEILDGLPASVWDSGHQQRAERRRRLKALLDNSDRATPAELRDLERQADNLNLEGNGLKRAQNRAADHLLRALTNVVERAPASAARVRLKQLCESLTTRKQERDQQQERKQREGWSFDSDGNSVTDESRPLPGLNSSAGATIGMLLCATLDGSTLRERLTAGGSETDKEMLTAFEVAEAAIISDPSQHWQLLEPLLRHRRAAIAQAACLILCHTPDPPARGVAFQALFRVPLTESRGYRTGGTCWNSADANTELIAVWEELLNPLRTLPARAGGQLSTAAVEGLIAAFGDSSDPLIAAMDIELIEMDRTEAKLRAAAAQRNADETPPPFEALLELADFLHFVRDDSTGARELRRQAYQQALPDAESASTTHAWNLARAGRRADAEAVFERALTEAPTSDTHCSVARFKEQCGDRDQAERLLRKAIEIAVQQNPYLYEGECQLALARLLAADVDRQGKARMAFDRAFELRAWRAAHDFSAFLASIREVDEAEAVLIAADTADGPRRHLDYGDFLAIRRRNPSAALERYERAGQAHWPDHDPARAANHAEMLLIAGATERGEALARRILRQVSGNSHIALATQVTRAIVGPPALRAEARQSAERIAQAGVNAGNWDFGNLRAQVVNNDDASWLDGLLR